MIGTLAEGSVALNLLDWQRSRTREMRLFTVTYVEPTKIRIGKRRFLYAGGCRSQLFSDKKQFLIRKLGALSQDDSGSTNRNESKRTYN